MSLGDFGAGAADAFRDLLVRQLAQQQFEQQMKLREAELNQRALEADQLAKYRNQSLEAQENARRDRANQAGLEDMFRQRSVMDAEADDQALDQIASDPNLPSNVRTVIGLRRRGVAGVNTMDLETPEQRAARERAEDEREFNQRVRITNATRTPSTPDQAWVIRDGKPTPIVKGTAQPGDTPYDPVAARQPTTIGNEEAIRTAEEVVRVAKSLRDHASRGSVFGAMEGMLPSVRQGSIDAQSLVDQLNGLLTLDNMGKMKGVLSDKDMLILRQASSRLANQRISDEAAYQELTNVINTVSQKIGGGNLGGGDNAASDPAASALEELLRRRSILRQK